jgi:2-polyprenyl-3-methyl-5-hydroxy-6-metoxy-1,4-benzoquinol methylase
LFNQVVRLVDKSVASRGGVRAVLDIGCSFGFLLDLFARQGWQTWGVEQLPHLRHEIQLKGVHRVFESLEEVPPSSQFDAVTLIDSLYCFANPGDLLAAIYARLKDGGVVVVRVTNRTPLLNLAVATHHKGIIGHLFGEQVVAFSNRGMHALASRTGFRVESVTGWESRPFDSFNAICLFFTYKSLSLLSVLVGKNLSLGLVYVLVKSSGSRE